jgi:hypothetical protein
VVGNVRKLCTAYKGLVTAAAAITASKGDTMSDNPDGVAERAEPVAEQQQLRLMDAFDKLYNSRPLMPLREQEIAAVHSAVTGAIAADTGTSVYAYGPRGSAEGVALILDTDSVYEWCEQHAKPEPISVDVYSSMTHPAGLYDLILQKLKEERNPIGVISEIAAEAQKQLVMPISDSNS